MTSKKFFKYNHPSKPLRLIDMYGWFDSRPLFLGRLRPEGLTIETIYLFRLQMGGGLVCLLMNLDPWHPWCGIVSLTFHQ